MRKLLPSGLMIVVLGGCSELLGFDAYRDDPTGSGGAGGATSSGVAGAGATAGVAGTMGGTTPAGGGGAGGTSGAGGTGGGCEACGEVQWVEVFGGTGDDHAHVIDARGSSNEVVVAGSFADKIDFGGITLGPGGLSDGYSASLTQAGAFLGVLGISGGPMEPSDQSVRAVAIGSDGSRILAGTFTGGVMANGGPVLMSVGKTDCFVLKLDANFSVIWAMSFGGTSDDSLAGMAVDSQGDVLVAANYTGKVSLGGTMIPFYGSQDVLVAKLSGVNGMPAWLDTFGSPSDDRATAVTLDATNALTVVGFYQANLAFENGDFIPNTIGNDAFAVHLDPSGNFIWKKGFGGGGDQIAYAASAALDGGVFVAGNFTGELKLDASYIETPGPNADGFVTKLDATGTPIASKVIPDMSAYPTEGSLSLATSPAGGCALAGSFLGTVDFGGGPVTSDGHDAFVVRLTPGFQYEWQQIIGGAGAQVVNALSFAKDGSLFAAGDFEIVVDVAGQAFISKGASDVFMMKLSP